MFSGCTAPPNRKETKLRSNDQVACFCISRQKYHSSFSTISCMSLSFFVHSTSITQLILAISLWLVIYHPLTQKDSITHMHGLAVYVKEGLCKGLVSRKLYWLLLMFLTGFTSLSVILLYPLSILYQSPSSFLCMVFDSISSDIDEALSINPSANEFVFGDFNIHHKNWLI